MKTTPTAVRVLSISLLLAGSLLPAHAFPANAADDVLLRHLDRPGWSGGPLLATNERGATVAVWAAAKVGSPKQSRVRYRWIGQDGAVGPIRVLRGTRGVSIGFLDAAVGSGRDITVTWSRYNGVLQGWDVWAIRVIPGQGATPKRRVSEQGVGGWVPSAAMTVTGHAAVTYRAPGRGYSEHQIVVLLDAQGQVRRRLGVAGMGASATPMVASPLDEFVLAGWSRGGSARITRVAPDGATRARRVTGDPLWTAVPSDVAVDARGAISVTLISRVAGLRHSLWLRTWGARGRLSPLRWVSPAGGSVYWATHAAAGSLRHVVWGAARPADNVLTVYTRTVGSGGRLGRVHQVGKVEKRPAPAYFDVAEVAASGSEVAVVWQWQLPGGAAAIWMSRLHRDGSIGVRHEVARGMGAGDVVVQPKGRVIIALAERQDGEPWLARVG